MASGCSTASPWTTRRTAPQSAVRQTHRLVNDVARLCAASADGLDWMVVLSQYLARVPARKGRLHQMVRPCSQRDRGPSSPVVPSVTFLRVEGELTHCNDYLLPSDVEFRPFFDPPSCKEQPPEAQRGARPPQTRTHPTCEAAPDDSCATICHALGSSGPKKVRKKAQRKPTREKRRSTVPVWWRVPVL